MPWQLHPLREYARLCADWDRLAAWFANAPFLQARFVAPLLAEFAQGSEWLAVHDEGAGATAMAIVARIGPVRWTTWQPSQLPLGAWVMHPSADLGALAGSLLRRLPGFALQLGLTQLDPLCVPRPADSASVRSLDYVRTAFVAVGGGFDDYWNARGKNLRANMRKQRRKLEAEHTTPRLEELRRRDDIAAALESYGRLESAGWKAALGTAIHPENAQGRFYRTMLENFCDAGMGVVYRYWLGDRVVAMDLCIEHRDTLVVLKTTYDESIKTLSPAFLLREDEMKTLFAEGRIARVEFFGKLMDWHSQWTRDERTLYHANCYRWSWLPRAQAIAARMLK